MENSKSSDGIYEKLGFLKGMPFAIELLFYLVDKTSSIFMEAKTHTRLHSFAFQGKRLISTFRLLSSRISFWKSKNPIQSICKKEIIHV